jgi:hypothetical protein
MHDPGGVRGGERIADVREVLEQRFEVVAPAIDDPP